MAVQSSKEVLAAFKKAYDSNKKIQALLDRIEKGATYKEADEYAAEVGEILADIYRGGILSEADAAAVTELVTAPLENNYDLVSSVCEKVQKSVNESAKIGLNPVKPAINRDRIDGLVAEVNDNGYDKVANKFPNQVVNYTQSVVDNSARVNMEFQAECGLDPQIVRTAEAGCCEWCQDLEDTYSYEDVKGSGSDVYRRHNNCRCIVEFVPHKGSGRQNVWSKKWYQADKETLEDRREYEPLELKSSPEKIEERKKAGPDFYVGPNGKVLEAKYAEWIGENQMNKMLEAAESDEVKKIIRSDFRPLSFIGTGNTASIRKFEIATGLHCGKPHGDGTIGTHEQKVHDLINQINKIPKDELCKKDLEILEGMLKELEEVDKL